MITELVPRRWHLDTALLDPFQGIRAGRMQNPQLGGLTLLSANPRHLRDLGTAGGEHAMQQAPYRQVFVVDPWRQGQPFAAVLEARDSIDLGNDLARIVVSEVHHAVFDRHGVM